MDLVEYVQSNNKTHIIFDFDATLFLLVLPWSNWMAGVRAAFVEADAVIWDQYERKELSLAELQNAYISSHGDAMRSFLNSHSESFERENLERYEPNTDLINTLEELADCSKYIWSSNATSTITAVLTETGLAHHFKKVVSRQDVERIKPDPAGFKLIHDDRVPKENTLWWVTVASIVGRHMPRVLTFT